jgi:LysR family hydrogen peroxide-inducible transcriptional activator
MPAKVTLSQIEAFSVVARLLSYTQAGEELGYSEAAVCQQVHRLQDVLRLQLLAKHRRGMVLTEAGKRLAQLADQIVSQVKNFEVTAEAIREEMYSRVRVASGNVTATFLLQHVLNRFGERHPDVRIEIAVTTSDTIVDGLTEGRYQIGIVAVTEASSPLSVGHRNELEAALWLEDEWIVVGPKRFRQGIQHEIRTIFYNTAYPASLPLLHICLSKNRLPHPPELVPLTTVDAVKAAALGGLGHAFQPGMAVVSELELGLLERALPAGVSRKLFIVRHRRLPPQAKLLYEFLRSWQEKASSQRGAAARA